MGASVTSGRGTLTYQKILFYFIYKKKRNLVYPVLMQVVGYETISVKQLIKEKD